MVPTVIDDDRAAARAINRRTLTGYVSLPNYRNYWKQAGYEEEMEAIEAALAAGDRDDVPTLMSDAWLDDCTLVGLGRRGARRHRGVAGDGRAADRGDVVDQRRPAQGHPGAVRRLRVGQRRRTPTMQTIQLLLAAQPGGADLD